MAERRNPKSPNGSGRNHLANNLKSKYGLLLEEYEAMVEAQEGRCAICGNLCITQQRLCVDHDHETGKVRGLLCRMCNVMLGNAADDPDVLRKGADYLDGRT